MGKKSAVVDYSQGVGLGIDVSKKTLEVALLDRDRVVHRSCIANEAEAIERWVGALCQARFSAPIVLESTARYHYLVAWRLSEAGLDVRVINPLLSSKHIRGQIRKTKTDRTDAEVLAWMVLNEPKLPPPGRIRLNLLQIRQKMGLLQRVDKQIQSLSRSVSDYRQSCEQLGLSLSEGEQALGDTLNRLKALRRLLCRELEDLIKASHCSEQDVQCLQSLPGISAFVSRLILTCLRPDVKQAKSWQAYVGLDISVKQSGTYRGRGRLTKRGNPYLRKRLYCAAWGAYMHYPEVRAYYDWLRTQGRRHKEALVIIARKLLGMAYALLQDKAHYDPKIGFVIPVA